MTVEPVSKKYQVYLRKYDIAHAMSKEMISNIAGFKVDGVWHTSIEVHDKEYFMGVGIECVEPGQCNRYGVLVDRMLLGETECDPETLKAFIEDHKDDMWAPQTYHMLDHNCNHFTDYLAKFLTSNGIPVEILELSEKAKTNPMFVQFYKQNQKQFHSSINSARGGLDNLSKKFK
ncbi:DESI1 [Enterospora canceri]|uniref:DESI1 n=1 Tax=Enterospora canceri TaxID=1081671 RepID=A0A1Y1SAH3_9MICR|nr:DESI1 [Enterospora canceri]